MLKQSKHRFRTFPLYKETPLGVSMPKLAKVDFIKAATNFVNNFKKSKTLEIRKNKVLKNLFHFYYKI